MLEVESVQLRVVGAAVRKRRLEQGWTQAELARAAGIRTHTVTACESGDHRAQPSTVRRIAEALRCSVPDIARVVDEVRP